MSSWDKVHPSLVLEGAQWGEYGAGIDVPKVNPFSVGHIIPHFKRGWDAPFLHKGIACSGHEQHQFFKTFLLISQAGADHIFGIFSTISLSNP